MIQLSAECVVIMENKQEDSDEKTEKEIKAQTISYRVLAEHRELCHILIEHIELISSYAPRKLNDNFELSLSRKQKLLYYYILGRKSMDELKTIVVNEIKDEN